jgi:hypothetical protein
MSKALSDKKSFQAKSPQQHNTKTQAHPLIPDLKN